MDDHDTNVTFLKVLIAWAGAIWGGITLSNLVLFFTLVYTALQTYVLFRDKVLRKPKLKDGGYTQPGGLP